MIALQKHLLYIIGNNFYVKKILAQTAFYKKKRKQNDSFITVEHYRALTKCGVRKKVNMYLIKRKWRNEVISYNYVFEELMTARTSDPVTPARSEL